MSVPAMARVMTGSLVIERIFGLPGMGSYFVDGAINRDYTLVMGALIIYATLIVSVQSGGGYSLRPARSEGEV